MNMYKVDTPLYNSIENFLDDINSKSFSTKHECRFSPQELFVLEAWKRG